MSARTEGLLRQSACKGSTFQIENLTGGTYLVQINLCTLAMRQQAMLDIFNLPASSSSQVHINVKKAMTSSNVVGSGNFCTSPVVVIRDSCSCLERWMSRFCNAQLPWQPVTPQYPIKRVIWLQAIQSGQDGLLGNQGNYSNRVVVATETLLGPECKNLSADVLPQLQLQQSWKPGRFMQDPKMDFALVTHLGMERCNFPLNQIKIVSQVYSVISLSASASSPSSLPSGLGLACDQEPDHEA